MTLDQRGAPSGRVAGSARAVVLVSARADATLRDEVAAGARPSPEYLLLERDYDIQLLDWSRVPGTPTRRTPLTSIGHALAALPEMPSTSAVLSDGEHVGLPLAGVIGAWPRRPRHVVIGHHLTTPAKRRLLSIPTVLRGVDAFVVHSPAQVDELTGIRGVPATKVHMLRYGVDTHFWRPEGSQTRERLIVSAGREHRDYATLAASVTDLDARVRIADGSAHSPAATTSVPTSWPPSVTRGPLSPTDLKDHYRRAAVVVVPVMETDFPAGITVVAEAMAMGKPVVATETEGLRGAVGDPDAVRWVPPDDPAAMRAAVQDLLEAPERADVLGRRARAAAERHHTLDGFGAGLHSLLAQPMRREGSS